MQVRLVTFIIPTVLVVSGVGVYLDYHREYNQHINVILASLEEQARTLKTARKRIIQPPIFAKYVDDFCAQMNEFISPGHHILILDETGAIMVSAQHHSGVGVANSLISANPDDQIICAGKHRLAQIRLKDEDGTTIVLAQYLDHMERILRSQLISRGLVTTVTAIILVFLIYLVIKSWVIKPVTNLVTAAKQWSKSNFSIRSDAMGSAEFRVLSEKFNSMAEQLETQENQRIGELEQARKIQTNLLPVSQPTVSGLSITAEYHPAKYIAGDLYDIFNLPDNRTAIIILDICGHGISAALLTGVVKMSLHRRLAENDDLAEAMKLVNKDLLTCTPEGKFVTACVGVWDQCEQTWTYCAAGHPGGLLLSQNNVQSLESTAPLLGVFLETDWPSDKIRLSAGDRIFLYTDGVADAGVTKGQKEPYNLDRILLNCNQLSLTEQVANIISKTIQDSSDEIKDDATIVAFEVLPTGDNRSGNRRLHRSVAEITGDMITL
ncbi:MAG: PP2C family protein-serine/threonine phosphatase [Planctomycetota bacterium]